MRERRKGTSAAEATCRNTEHEIGSFWELKNMGRREDVAVGGEDMVWDDF